MKKMCSFYYSLKSLYSFTHNLFKKKGMQVTHVRVFRENLRRALRFKWTSCKSKRKSLLKSCSYHIRSLVCVHAHAAQTKPTANADFISLPFPSENHWLETEIGQEDVLPCVWILHRRAWTLPWSPRWGMGCSICTGLQRCASLFQGHSLGVETLNMEVFALGGC